MSFERFAGACGVIAGVAGLVYSIAFVFLKSPALYSVCLMIGGLATVVVLVALYRRLMAVDGGVAQTGLLLGAIAAVGSVIHGGYDLGNAVNPPAAAKVDLPSQIDPRGLLTFGVAGLALLAFAWLLAHSRSFPRTLAYVAYALAVLLIVVYLGRLIVLDANSLAILIPAAIAGFIINPLWNIWVGLTLLRNDRGV